MGKKKSPASSLTIVSISDTHTLHREVDIPGGDILIHSGDFTMFSRDLNKIEDFNDWLGELPHPHKIVVPGNHEFFLASDPSRRSLLSNAVVLINEGIEMEGLRFWGSPVTSLRNAAFGMPAAEDRKRLYAQIPNDPDILITHGPPYGILDAESVVHAGCQELLAAVKRLKPKLHVFGHIHGGYGILEIEQTVFVNAALLGPHGDIDRSPIVFRMNRQ